MEIPSDLFTEDLNEAGSEKILILTKDNTHEISKLYFPRNREDWLERLQEDWCGIEIDKPQGLSHLRPYRIIAGETPISLLWKYPEFIPSQVLTNDQALLLLRGKLNIELL